MSKARNKGTAFETLICNWMIREVDEFARRLGFSHKGDIWLPTPASQVVECKNVNSLSLNTAWSQIEKSKLAADRPHGLLIHKRVGVGPAEFQWATATVEDYFGYGTARYELGYKRGYSEGYHQGRADAAVLTRP